MGASRDFALFTHSQSPESLRDKFCLSSINSRQREALQQKSKTIKKLRCLVACIVIFLQALSSVVVGPTFNNYILLSR